MLELGWVGADSELVAASQCKLQVAACWLECHHHTWWDLLAHPHGSSLGWVETREVRADAEKSVGIRGLEEEQRSMRETIPKPTFTQGKELLCLKAVCGFFFLSYLFPSCWKSYYFCVFPLFSLMPECIVCFSVRQYFIFSLWFFFINVH